MTNKMLIDAAHPDEARMAIIRDGDLYDYDFVTSFKNQIKGNIYLAKVTRVEPSLQAAFVEYGGGKQGFLPFSEIHPDYYNMPVSDKEKLLAEQIAEAEAEEAEEEEAFEREQAAREARKKRRGRKGPRKNSNDEDDSDEDDDSEDVLDSDDDADDIVADSDADEDEDGEGADSDIAEDGLEPHPIAQDALENENADSNASNTEDALDADDNNASYIAQEQASISTKSEPVSGENADEISETIEGDAAPSIEGAEAGGKQEAEDKAKPRNNKRRGNRPIAFYRRYKIQEVIKRNQIILVQITKEERGNKGCSLTTYISLAGRYSVLMPNSPKGGGISRKITDRETRRRLKEIASSLRAHRTMSLIIRTAGLDREQEDIARDYEYLVKLWNNIREETLKSTAPCLVYEESNLVKRAIRDSYTNDIEAIEVEGTDAHKEAKEFVKMLMPGHEKKVKRHREKNNIFTKYDVDEELESLLSPQVKLPSGGYLIINPTEALISIDVNSGRSTTERNVEETAIKTNLEAAKEVARQMRLRDLAGLVVIDFIDMNYGKHRRQVERCMRDATKQDRAKLQLSRISTFGLMELSRQRIRPSLSEALSIVCPHCKGAGVIHSPETVAFQVIRTLEKEAASEEYKELRVSAPSDVVLKLLNEKRHLLHDIETRYKLVITVLIDSSISTASFKLAKITLSGKEVMHDAASAKKSRRNEKPKRRKSSNADQNKKAKDDSADTEAKNDSADTEDSTATDTGDDSAEAQDKPKRRSRGGRRSSKSDDKNEDKPKRRSRGGRRNTRNSKKAGDKDDGGEKSDDGDSDADPKAQANGKDTPATPYETTGSEKSETVVALSQAATNITPVPEDTIDDPDKPKRKGWWSRVLES